MQIYMQINIFLHLTDNHANAAQRLMPQHCGPSRALATGGAMEKLRFWGMDKIMNVHQPWKNDDFGYAPGMRQSKKSASQVT